MLLALQIPLIDARAFLVDQPHRLGRPDFLTGPNEKRRLERKPPEFIRGVGPFQERRRSPVTNWPAEGYYCGARRALRLVEPFQPPAHSQPFDVAFRRFHWNGSAVARFEIGLVRPRRSAARAISAPEVIALLREFAEHRVAVPIDGVQHRTSLGEAGSLLADQVLRNTTDWQAAGPEFVPEEWWVTAGRPIGLLEYEGDELASLPRHALAVPEPEPGLHVHHLKLHPSGAVPPTWLIGLGSEANVARSREIRVHLFRLHAEREALRQMLRHLGDEQVDLPATGAVRSELVEYLDKSVGFLRRKKVYGTAQSELLRAAYDVDDLFAGADRVSLLSALDQRRRSLAQRLAEVAPDVPAEGYSFPLD